MIDHLEVGGAQRHTVLLASWLARAGHEVVLAFAGPARIPVDPAVMLLPLSLESVSRRRDAVFEEAALALARRFQPTVVHAHLYASALAAAGVAERHDLPLVLSHHSNGTWQTESDRRLLAWPLRRASHQFTASPQIRQAVIDLGAHPSRVEFLANAVPLPEQPVAPQVLSKSLRIGFLARFTQDKDPLTLLRAVARLRRWDVPAQLTMRGEGELEEELRSAVRLLQLDSVVCVDRPVESVGEFFSAIDVLCLPSRSEGMPLAVLEAMGHGLPVVATRVGAVPVEVHDGVTGLLAEAGDDRALATRLAWMWRHPAGRRRMGKRGRLRARRRFSLERMGKRVEAVYARLAVGVPLRGAR
jgi:glycosyltransferase involved in cell wall biosynthesis